MNPDYEEIGVTPFDIVIRDQIGLSLEIEQIETIDEVVKKLLNNDSYSKEKMREIREKYLYNVSHSSEIEADYIIKRLIEKSTL